MNEYSPSKPELLTNLPDYETYRKFCDDTSTAYRPIGIQTKEQYDKAIVDESTIFSESEFGVYPVAVKIEFSDGYDVERCKKLTNKENVYLMSIPLSELIEPIDLPENSALIIESDHDLVELDRKNAKELILINNNPADIHDFIDERIEDKDHKNAFMGIYAGIGTLNEGVDYEKRGENLKEVFDSYNYELLPDNGLTLFSNEDFNNHPEIYDELWELFKDRFEWLGDYHPISMEDTREVFDEIVLSGTTFSPLKFKDGRLICAGIIANNLEDINWLSEKTINQFKAKINNNMKLEYFFGIAAKTDKDMEGNMRDIVRFHSDLAKDIGSEFTIVFESSNMSSLYIPQKTEEYINASNFHHVRDGFRTVSQIDFWYLSDN